MDEYVMKITKRSITMLAIATVILSGCMSGPAVKQTASEPVEPEKLYISNDGTMYYRDRPINSDDVVIYPDGFGGERAAVKLSLEPLHPPFYRDTIVVVREPETKESEKTN